MQKYKYEIIYLFCDFVLSVYSTICVKTMCAVHISIIACSFI